MSSMYQSAQVYTSRTFRKNRVDTNSFQLFDLYHPIKYLLIHCREMQFSEIPHTAADDILQNGLSLSCIVVCDNHFLNCTVHLTYTIYMTIQHAPGIWIWLSNV